MSAQGRFAQLSLGAVRALAQEDRADFEVFLSSPSGDEPVLYRRAGAGLSQPDFARMAEFGGTHVYVRAEDFHRCEEALEDRLCDIIASPHIAPADKAEIIQGTGTTVARDLTSGHLDAAGFDRSANVVEGMIGCILGDERIAAHLLEMADHERTTASHMFVVGTLAVMLGAEVYGDDPQMLKDLGFAGMLHDLGKLSIDPAILNKSGPLNREELALIHQHPVESVRLIGDDPHLTARTRQMILQHHERVDGLGYPVGVSGADLLHGSRLLCIVDSFHAMIGRRCYRASTTPMDANRVLATQAGRQFDADLLACWTGLCARHQPRPSLGRKWKPSRGSETAIAARQEHRPVPPTPKVAAQRPTRHACKGTTTVQCIYAGRLNEASSAPAEFSALVHDVSRRGMCIYTAHPMYRGEEVHVRLDINADPAWIRGVVAWSRQQDDNLYRTGLKFTQRIPERESQIPGEVRDLPSLSPAALNRAGRKSQQCQPAITLSEVKPVRDKRAGAMKTLAAITAMRRPSASAQRTVVTLVMSSDVRIRLKVVDVLTNLGTRVARDALVSMLKDDNSEVREKAMTAVGALQIGQGVGPLKEILRGPSDTAALHAAGALGRLGDESGLPLVARALEDDGPNGRLAARMLGDITGHRFAASREGVRSARRYLAARKQLLGA